MSFRASRAAAALRLESGEQLHPAGVVPRWGFVLNIVATSTLAGEKLSIQDVVTSWPRHRCARRYPRASASATVSTNRSVRGS